MANPRQRRKTKSSNYKAVSHSKRAKRLQKKMPAIRGPKALQDAWDRTKTLRQNYVALGLEHDLNPFSSGGSEVDLSRSTDRINTSQVCQTSSASDGEQFLTSERPAPSSTLRKGCGRIVRDSNGVIVRVELPCVEGTEDVTKRDQTMDGHVAVTKSDLSVWARETWEGAGPGGIGSIVVQDLEKLADSAGVRERHTSLGERLYLQRLVHKYAEDTVKMARDRRLNPQQRTENELQRAIAKAGGYEELCKSTDNRMAG